MPQIKTREEWLNRAADIIANDYNEVFRTHFDTEGIDRLGRMYVSTGFPSRGGLGKVIGECWKAEASESGERHHIFINPRLTDIVEVVATLAHEMVHAADNGEHKHKGPFTKAVRELGLQGKPTATFAGEEFAAYAKKLSDSIGTYPHEGLVPLMEEKKQSTRMLKLECGGGDEAAGGCGYVLRTTKKWIEIGLPTCACGKQFPYPEGYEPGEPGDGGE